VREHRRNIRERERKIESVKNDYERRNFVEKAIISLTGEVPREIKKYESEIKSIEKKIENLGVYREKFIEINKEEDKRKFTLEKAKAVVWCRSIDRSIEQG
jgi:hypothetical protein